MFPSEWAKWEGSKKLSPENSLSGDELNTIKPKK